MTPKTIDNYGGVKVDAEASENPTSELAADHFNRAAEDLAQATRTVDRVIVSFETRTSAGTVTITDNTTVWGEGASYTPTVARAAQGIYTITYATSYTDGLNESEPVQLRFPKGQLAGSTFGEVQCEMTSANVITARIFDAAGSATDAGGSKVVTVWAR